LPVSDSFTHGLRAAQAGDLEVGALAVRISLTEDGGMVRSTWASSDGLSRNCMFPVMCWAPAPVSDSSIRIEYELIFFDWSAAAWIACCALWLAVCPPDPWSPEPCPLPDPEPLLLLCPPAGVKAGCGLLPPPHPASAASPRPAASRPGRGPTAGWRVRRRVSPYLAIIAILPKVGGPASC
jgi:hypothetical protein